MKAVGTYSPYLDIQIECLAAGLMTHAMVVEQISALDNPTVTTTSRYGSKTEPHPVFKIQRDLMAEITRQSKILKLTVEDIIGKPEKAGPLDQLTAELNKI